MLSEPVKLVIVNNASTSVLVYVFKNCVDISLSKKSMHAYYHD